MKIILLTALGVGGATVIGAVVGFLLGSRTVRFSNTVLAFSAGVMLSASIFGLIQPALESPQRYALPVALAGIFAGALCMDALGRLVTKLRPDCHSSNQVVLFVTAIAIHNLPEGIAAGVGFGTGSISGAMMIAGGIALQNLPEGMVIISPMLSVGVSRKKTLLIAICTGILEVIGTFLGYFAVGISSCLLPFLLTFAGGTMLFIICGEMIPQVSSEKNGSYALLVGFSIMLILGAVL